MKTSTRTLLAALLCALSLQASATVAIGKVGRIRLTENQTNKGNLRFGFAGDVPFAGCATESTLLFNIGLMDAGNLLDVLLTARREASEVVVVYSQHFSGRCVVRGVELR